MSTILKKKVNVYPRGPITNVNPPIRVPVKNILLPIVDIRKCVLAGAKVEEILPDKTLVKLTLHNYDQDNGGVITPVDQPNIMPNKKPIAHKAPAKKQLTKEEMDKLKEKLNKSNNPLKDIITRTADEADEINKKEAVTAPVEEEIINKTDEVSAEESITPQRHLTRRQLRKIREEQEAAAAKKNTEEQPVVDPATVIRNAAKTESTPLADALKSTNTGEEVIVKDVAKL